MFHLHNIWLILLKGYYINAVIIIITNTIVKNIGHDCEIVKMLKNVYIFLSNKIVLYNSNFEVNSVKIEDFVSSV